MTNIEKFEQVFGFKPTTSADCIGPLSVCSVTNDCKNCQFRNWWNREFTGSFSSDAAMDGVLDDPLIYFSCDGEGYTVYTSPRTGWTSKVRNHDVVAYNSDGIEIYRMKDTSIESLADLKKFTDNLYRVFSVVKAIHEECVLEN